MINELQNSLEHLRFFIPPAGIMVIGAGNGSSLRSILGWNLDNVVLIEADAAQSAKVERAFALPESWQVFNTVVGTSDDATPFYRASNPAHNGMLNPESLRAIWPNLCANDTEMVLPVGIDALVSDNGLSGINWLFIECFPVIDIARSAEKLLEGCEVVVVRTLDDACAEGTSSGNFDVEGWFGARGFRLARRIDTDHPSVFNLLFVCDFQQQISVIRSESEAREKNGLMELQKGLEEQKVLMQKTQEELIAAQASKEEHSKWAHGLKKQLEDLQKKYKEKEDEVKSLTDSKHELIDEKSDLEQKLSMLQNELKKIDSQLDLIKELNQYDPK